MSRIQQLSTSVSEQIAAGEVVEKPASVVKELIENAIDAGSQNIQVYISKAGKESIRVIDDGRGIHPEDIELAFQRHTTSKIYRSEDLNRIKTLGFRGEALASIAAVSRVEVKTRQQGKQEGVYLLVEGGDIKTNEPVGCPEGTDIEVKDLFYNTPARLKFLKKQSTEIAWIQDIVNKMALANPQIRFKLIHENNRLLQTTGQNDLLEVISRIYGYQTAKKLLKVSKEQGEMALKGYISRPEITRSNRRYQNVYINLRYVNNNLVSNSLEKGYHTLLPKHRYPIAILKLWLPETELDVNVHPAKTQVRFSDPGKITEFVEKAVSETLAKANLIFPVSDKSPGVSNKDSFRGQKSTENASEQMNFLGYKRSTKAFDQKEKYSNNNSGDRIKEQEEGYNAGSSKAGSSKAGSSKAGSSIDERIEADTESPSSNPASNRSMHLNGDIDGSSRDQDITKLIEAARIVGQFFSTYWLLELGEELYFVDQHAAHERVNYHALMEKYQETKTITQQVIPYTLELDSASLTVVQDNISVLKACGIELELFQNQTILVRSVPQAVKDILDQEAVQDLIEQFVSYPEEKIDIETAEEILITTACKKSIKANQKMEKQDFIYLLERLADTPNSFTCPHGRPTIVKMTRNDIEKLFYRV